MGRLQIDFVAILLAVFTVTQPAASVAGAASSRLSAAPSCMATQALVAPELGAQMRLSEAPGRVHPTMAGLLDLEVQRHLNDGRLSPEQAVRRLEEQTALSPHQVRTLEAEFQEDMLRGIEGKSSSLEMIPSHLKEPTGNERGIYPVLSQGGTRSEYFVTRLNGDHTTTVLARGEFRLGKSDITGSGERLLSAIAKNLKALTGQDGRPLVDARRPTRIVLALAFSVKMVGTGVAILLGTSKGFNGKDLLGKDILAPLNAAFSTAGLLLTRAVTVINDTVTVKLLAAYRNRSRSRRVLQGLILGTGYNVSTDIALTPGGEVTTYNMEAGAFDKVAKFSTVYDAILDAQSTNPGQHLLEKQVSGKYLGELVRLAVRQFPQQTDLFHGWADASLFSKAYTVLSAPPFSALGGILILSRAYKAAADALSRRSAFALPYGLSTEDVSAILADDATPDLREIDRFLGQRHIFSTLEERQALRRIAVAFVRRSVRLVDMVHSASLTSPLVPDSQKWDQDKVIAVDGSVFQKTPHYQEWLKEDLVPMLGAGRAAKVIFEFTPGGTVEGGAVAGALVMPMGNDEELAPVERLPTPRKIPIYSHFTAYAA